MKFFLFKIGVVCCVLFGSACRQGKQAGEGDGLKNIPIDLTRLEESRPLEDYIDSVEFIPLETNDSVLIHRIAGLTISDGRIYVRDELQGCVFVFDRDGKFLFKIDRMGKGPDEYMYLLGMNVDREHIIIRSLSDIVLYDKTNGDFVKKIHIHSKDFVPAGMYVDSIFYYFIPADGFPECEMQATVLVFDKRDFSLQRGYVDPFAFEERPFASSSLISSPYGLLFHQTLNDTIYRLGEEGMEPLFFLNAGKNQFTYDMYKKAPLMDGSKKIPYKAICPIGSICFTDEYLSFICYQEKNDPAYKDVFYCFYFWDTGEMKVFEQKKLHETKYFVNFFDFDAMDKRGYRYAICYPSLLTAVREHRKIVVDERFDKMQAEDNPWLIKYRLKF